MHFPHKGSMEILLTIFKRELNFTKTEKNENMKYVSRLIDTGHIFILPY